MLPTAVVVSFLQSWFAHVRQSSDRRCGLPVLTAEYGAYRAGVQQQSKGRKIPPCRALDPSQNTDSIIGQSYRKAVQQRLNHRKQAVVRLCLARASDLRGTASASVKPKSFSSSTTCRELSDSVGGIFTQCCTARCSAGSVTSCSEGTSSMLSHTSRAINERFA